MSLDGYPSAAEVLLYTDSIASLIKYSYQGLGLNAAGDTTSASYYSDLARKKILGDGGSNPGLGAPAWERNVNGALNSLAASCRWDGFYASRLQTLCGQLDTLVASYLPTGWKFPTTSSQAHVFDLFLARQNAVGPLTPATPSTTGVLTAAANPLGSIPDVLVGNAPRVVYCLVGASDANESLPSPECAQVALVGSQNSYNLAISGTVPSGIFNVRVYRGVIGAATGVYAWDQDVPVSPSATFPVIHIVQADAQLRTDVAPPVWASCLITPEFAAAFALAYSSSASTFSPSSSSVGVSVAVSGQLSPINVALTPSNGLLGIGNVPSTGVFGTSTVTGAGTQTYSAGVIATANNAAANVQGFVGGLGGLRTRVVTALVTGVCTPTISYTYLDASHGQSIQTQTGVSSSAFATGALGDVVTFTVTAGRVVLSATVTSVSGAATAGQFVIESQSVRSI